MPGSPSRQTLLQAFVAAHRGLRLGMLFGTPAVFAGRRVAIRQAGRDVDVRLSPAGRDLARATLGRRLKVAPRGWVRITVPAAGQPADAFLRVCERAVRDVVTA